MQNTTEAYVELFYVQCLSLDQHLMFFMMYIHKFHCSEMQIQHCNKVNYLIALDYSPHFDPLQGKALLQICFQVTSVK